MKQTSSLKPTQRIFVNRSLNMAHVKCVGFDMDHTLIPYKRENFESLAFRETLKKFLEAGYPAELEQLEFKPSFVMRGLVVDIERGNILKVDGHKYVKNAFHGRRNLEKSERHALYNAQSFPDGRFLSIDTFFELSEVQLFVDIVDYMRRNPGAISKSFAEVYDDIKRFIDASHQDGSIKGTVLRDPEAYIAVDKALPEALMRLKDADKKLFLLTNSNDTYTAAVMEYAFAPRPNDTWSDWRDLWNIKIVSASKPSFFSREDPFLVSPSVGEPPSHEPVEAFDASKMYHGGNATAFQTLSGFSGDQILYVGDHIFGDIIRSKATLNWRTLLIVDELAQEFDSLERVRPVMNQVRAERQRREELDERAQIIRSRIGALRRQPGGKNATKSGERDLAGHMQSLDEIKGELAGVEERLKQLIREREAYFDPVWGELMKVNLERSRFARQLSHHACMYTTRVSNLRFYSPYKKFFSFYDKMPHDECIDEAK